MKHKTALIAAMLTATVVFGGLAQAANATSKVTICHAAGREGTTKFVTLTISHNAVYGPAGHFYENGTPRAGHEQDYLGACQSEPTTTEPTPTTEPEPTTTVPDSPTTTEGPVTTEPPDVPDAPDTTPDATVPAAPSDGPVPVVSDPLFTG